MTTDLREVILANEALEQMVVAKPSADEQAAIINLLRDLGKNPLLGYEIVFDTPLSTSKTYRLDAGRFRIHYRFDDKRVSVAFIGVY